MQDEEIRPDRKETVSEVGQIECDMIMFHVEVTQFSEILRKKSNF